MRRTALLPAMAVFLALGSPALRAVWITDAPPVPQMRLAYFLEEDPAAPYRPDMALPLRADSPPVDPSPRTRFVATRKANAWLRAEYELTCQPGALERAVPVNRFRFSPLEQLDPLEWVTGTLLVRREPTWLAVTFSGAGRRFDASLPRSVVGLEANVQYRVTVRIHDGFAPSIEKILRRDEVVYDASICDRHGARMVHANLPITWGMPSDWNMWPSAGGAVPSAELRTAEFPHYLERLNGGCVVASNDNTRPTYICPVCRDAFLAWRARLPR